MVRQHWKRLKTIGGNMVVGPKTIPSRKPLAYMDKNHWPLGKIKKNRHISSSLSEGSSHEDRVDNHSGVWVSFSIQQMESRTASIFYLFTCPDGGCKRRNYPNSVWLKQMWRNNNNSWNLALPCAWWGPRCLEEWRRRLYVFKGHLNWPLKNDKKSGQAIFFVGA